MQSRTPGFGTALAVSLTLGLTGCAAPEPPPEGVRPADRADDDRLRALDGASRSWAQRTFRALDADGDGGLSTAEIDAAPESLAALDGDGDGRLSGGELGLPGGGSVRILARPRQQIPEGTPGIRLDLDAGDTLDIAELPPQFQGLLSSVDADGDGTASAGELLALMGAEAGGPADPEPGSAEGRAAPPPAGNGGEAPPTARTCRCSSRRSTRTGTARSPGRRGNRPRSRCARSTPTATGGLRRTSCGPPRAAATRGSRSTLPAWTRCFGTSAARRGGSPPSAGSPSPRC